MARAGVRVRRDLLAVVGVLGAPMWGEAPYPDDVPRDRLGCRLTAEDVRRLDAAQARRERRAAKWRALGVAGATKDVP